MADCDFVSVEFLASLRLGCSCIRKKCRTFISPKISVQHGPVLSCIQYEDCSLNMQAEKPLSSCQKLSNCTKETRLSFVFKLLKGCLSCAFRITNYCFSVNWDWLESLDKSVLPNFWGKYPVSTECHPPGRDAIEKVLTMEPLYSIYI